VLGRGRFAEAIGVFGAGNGKDKVGESLHEVSGLEGVEKGGGMVTPRNAPAYGLRIAMVFIRREVGNCEVARGCELSALRSYANA